MNQLPRIEVEIEGIDELKALLVKTTKQADELRETVEQINAARLTIQAKINQPTAATDG